MENKLTAYQDWMAKYIVNAQNKKLLGMSCTKQPFEFPPAAMYNARHVIHFILSLFILPVFFQLQPSNIYDYLFNLFTVV